MKNIRYTINSDGTLEKWFLEKDCGEEIALRKTPTPKFFCSMRIFPKEDVYENARTARKALRMGKISICR